MPSKLEKIATELAPQSKTIDVKDGVKLEIRGLQSGEIAEIAAKHPGFGEFINSARDASFELDPSEIPADGEEMSEAASRKVGRKFDMNKLFALGGNAYPAIIAAAVGEHGDPKTEEIAAGFAMEFQGKIVAEIMAMTFPRDSRRPLAEKDGN